jgi:hypothetical protein
MWTLLALNDEGFDFDFPFTKTKTKKILVHKISWLTTNLYDATFSYFGEWNANVPHKKKKVFGVFYVLILTAKISMIFTLYF